MNLITLAVGKLATNCYLYYNSKNEAILIDPGYDGNKIIETINNNKLSIKHIIITHGHFDHVGAVPEINKKHKAPIYLHKKDFEEYKSAKQKAEMLYGIKFPNIPIVLSIEFVKEGDLIEIDECKLKVVHTPGHSQGSISIIDEKNRMIFSGDTLFFQNIGRTDIPGASQSQLVNSIRNKLFNYSNDYKVYPGHGSPTTIGNEKKFNPVLVM